MPGNTGRRVYINLDPTESTNISAQQTHSSLNFINNLVITSKYTIINFVPKNLLLQFRRFANIFFLFIAIVQVFYLEQNSDRILGCFPLTIVLVISAIKDASEDYKRHKVDKLFNRSNTTSLQNWQNINLKEKNSKKSRDNNKGIDPLDPHSKMNEPIKPCFKHCYWESVEVGDFLLIEKEEQVPADVLIISTSDATSGECYVETKSLDGETNLKTRYAVLETMYISNPEECAELKGYVEVDAPSSNMHVLNGSISLLPTTKNLAPDQSYNTTTMSSPHSLQEKETLSSQNKIVPFSIKNMLLRGYVLKNIDYVIGMVIYTGKDTRIVLNSGKTPNKISKIEKKMNKQVITNFIALLALTLVICVAYIQIAKQELETKASTMFGILGSSVRIGINQFFIAIILLQNVVPVSLYVTVEMIKTFHALMISSDINMYDGDSNYRCIPRSWTLSDDLGQIEYIFSDKTGTLTRNIMDLKKLIIGYKVYGKDPATKNSVKANNSLRGTKKERMKDKLNEKLADENERNKNRELMNNHYKSMNKLFEPKYATVSNDPEEVSFVDSDLFEDMMLPDSSQNSTIREFLTHLALCHSVLIDNSQVDTGDNQRKDSPSEKASNCIETKKNNSLLYRAESPDEKTLVTSAKDLGFTYLSKSKNVITIDVLGEEKSYQVLDLIEFDSARKRMSVIVKRPAPHNDIVLLCKGADNIIIERLQKDQDDHIKFVSNNIRNFSTIGLRTLCLSYRVLEEKYYNDWHQKYLNAQAISQNSNREEKIEALCDELESEMVLIGATAIEDKLQDKVPETIKALRLAGIKVWVLTGDKMETAINIGMSCNLITDELKIWTVGAGTKRDVKENFEHIAKEVTDPGMDKNQHHAIVIEGVAFKHVLEDAELRELFRDISWKFSSVICCRVTPLQKAQAVHLIKKGKGSMCLSIGDGANDVSMIQEAHIGVAIAGQEGLQASMASDYSISQFKYLQNLLLVHGQWSYHRLSQAVLCFFYKSALFPLVAFWYQFYCGFSSNIFYVYLVVQLYNMMFTSFGAGLLGCFDRILNYEILLNTPQLYRQSKKGDLFSYKMYCVYVLDGVWQSLVCFYVYFFIFNDGITTKSGLSEGGLAFSTGSSAAIVIVVNLLIGFQTKSWVVWIFVSVVLSVLSLFIILPIYSLFHADESYYYVAIRFFANANFWISIPLVVILSMLPRYLLGAYKAMFAPSDYDIIRESRK